MWDAVWKLIRRVRAALAILILPGDRMPVTRHELIRFQLEWQEWQITFNGILDKLNAWNARQAKREKRALERTADAPEGASANPADRRSRKLQLYRKAAGATAPVAVPSPDSLEVSE